MRKSLTLVLLFFGMPALAQVQGGHETVQDAIRFERQKDAAAARQAKIESRRADSTANRAMDEENKGSKNNTNSKTSKPSKARKGSAR